MIKTIQMTSLLAILLAGAMFLFPAGFGAKSNEELEQLLKKPNAVEKYQKSKGQRASKDRDQVPPLVKEAKSFALYLNPPKTQRPRRRSGNNSVKKKPKPKPKPKAIPETKPKAKVTAKFKLIGTAYYPSRPKLSMALIDQPGKGLSWVNQGQELNHLLFKDIKNGVVTVQDTKGPRQISVPERVEEQRIRNLLNEGNKEAKRKAASEITAPQPATVTPQVNPEEKKKMEAFMSQLKKANETASEGTEDGGNKTQKEMIKQFFSNFRSSRSSRISDDEANQVRDLGETLDKKQQPSPTPRSRETNRTRGRMRPGRGRNPDEQTKDLPESDRKKRIEELKKLLQQRRSKDSPAETPQEQPKSRKRSSKIAQ